MERDNASGYEREKKSRIRRQRSYFNIVGLSRSLSNLCHSVGFEDF